VNIAIIGTGYVGLVSGACFAEFGIQVTCVDQDEERVARLTRGELPFFEPGLAELVRRHSESGRLTFTTDTAAAIQRSLVLFIAVGTPAQPDGSSDLSAVDRVASEVGASINGYKVVVTKSTVPVGTAQRIAAIIAETTAGTERAGYRCSVTSNPEFLREGSAVGDFMRPDRVIIGAEDDEAVAILRDLYSPLYLVEVPFVVTTVMTAELIKYAANAFLATKISFINEIANLCEAVDADVHVVARAMGLDGRISSKFLHPGPGFGGSCFPKDTASLVAFSRTYGVEQRVVSAVCQVNEQQRVRMAEKIERAVGGDLDGKRIAVLGLSFKPNTDDVRDSPAIDVVRQLQDRGAEIRCFDPQAMENAAQVLKDVEFGSDAYDTMRDCHALVIATEWNEFRKLDLDRLRELLVEPVIVDLRNVYEPARMREQGFRYSGVGR
jgi:UDPglucose 6-dehydrogenase